jgi:hypothetical protein
MFGLLIVFLVALPIGVGIAHASGSAPGASVCTGIAGGVGTAFLIAHFSRLRADR